ILVDMTNPHRAINFGTVVYGGNLVVFGGSKKVVSNGRKVYTNKVHIYSFSSGLWYELKSLSKEYETNGVLVNNTIYVIGGFDDRPLKEVRTYNIDTGENGEEAELFEEMSRPGLVCWRGIIYIFDNGKLLTYDTDMKVLKEYLIDFYVENANLTISKGSLYIIGGFKSKQFSKRPSQKMIRVNLNVLDRTRINRIKSF
ncbi:MAG TPA: galactose oxidase, partial [Pricia antarctica]|nr:galactose oxidase [Pricia antarctica]